MEYKKGDIMSYKCAQCNTFVFSNEEIDYFIVIDDEQANFCSEQCKEMYLDSLGGYTIVDDVFVEQLPKVKPHRFDVV